MFPYKRLFALNRRMSRQDAPLFTKRAPLIRADLCEIILSLLLSLATGCFPLTCGEPVPVSRFGAYVGPFKTLRLPGGDTTTVFRVRLWDLDQGGRALQLEYRTLIALNDTAAVRAVSRKVWSVFIPYVEELHLSTAVITATSLSRSSALGGPVLIDHLGFVAHRAREGTWYFTNDPSPLPAATADTTSGIFEGSGQRTQLIEVRPQSQLWPPSTRGIRIPRDCGESGEDTSRKGVLLAAMAVTRGRSARQ